LYPFDYCINKKEFLKTEAIEKLFEINYVPRKMGWFDYALRQEEYILESIDLNTVIDVWSLFFLSVGPVHRVRPGAFESTEPALAGSRHVWWLFLGCCCVVAFVS
jgi:hypothetical protein